MIRNREMNILLSKFLLFTIIFSISVMGIFHFYNIKMNKEIIKRDTALIGRLYNFDIEVEDVIGIITKGYDEDDYKVGRTKLNKYGYIEGIDNKDQIVLKNIIKYNILSILLLILSIFPIYIFMYLNDSKIYQEINNIIMALDKIIMGDYEYILDDKGIGDLNVLKYKLNKMTNIIKNNLEILKREKIFLKDSISDISHQLKTPLSSLKLFNELMVIDETMDSLVRIDFLQKSKKQLNRMNWLIINLLKVAKIESNTIEFKKDIVSLDNIINNCIINIEAIKKDKKIIFIKNDIKIKGDSHWMEESFTNIIKNAIEHGGDIIEIEIKEGPIFIDIFIRDNGYGIEEEKLPFIFERFYRDVDKSDSIGIGLNLAKIIIEKQDGTIYVKSKRDIGTEFRIRFLKE